MYTTKVAFNSGNLAIGTSGLLVVFLFGPDDLFLAKIPQNTPTTVFCPEAKRQEIQKKFPHFSIGGNFSPLWGNQEVYGVSRKFLRKHQLPHLTSSEEVPCKEDKIIITDIPRQSRIFKRLVSQSRSNGFRYIINPDGFFYIEGPRVIKMTLPIKNFIIL